MKSEGTLTGRNGAAVDPLVTGDLPAAKTPAAEGLTGARRNVVTYTVVVAVANPSDKLVPGMTASLRFVTAHRADVLKVPNTALRFRPPAAAPASAAKPSGSTAQHARPAPASRDVSGSGEGLVWVLGRAGRPAPVQVTLGITDGTSTEILRGDLSPGQAILVGLESPSPAPAPSTGPGFRP